MYLLSVFVCEYISHIYFLSSFKRDSKSSRSTLATVPSLSRFSAQYYNLHEASHNRQRELGNAIYAEKIQELSLLSLEMSCPGDSVVAIKNTDF